MSFEKCLCVILLSACYERYIFTKIGQISVDTLGTG
jgi:hypothetical protein